MYPNRIGLSAELVTAHTNSWQDIAQAGSFFTGADRVAMVRCAREALECDYCQARKQALSPNSVSNSANDEHDHSTGLNPVIVEVIHRIKTDPGRLTKSWFNHITQQLSPQQYVEIVSVVTTAVIVDTLHNALGLGLPDLPSPGNNRCDREYNPQAIEAGAWLPILDAPDTMADTGLPEVPNIVRALGLVPKALNLFFNTFRPHYALKNIPLSISQAQAEFVAARVSAINECFY